MPGSKSVAFMERDDENLGDPRSSFERRKEKPTKGRWSEDYLGSQIAA